MSVPLPFVPLVAFPAVSLIRGVRLFRIAAFTFLKHVYRAGTH